jgi:hypothetical protein
MLSPPACTSREAEITGVHKATWLLYVLKCQLSISVVISLRTVNTHRLHSKL